MLTAMTEEDWTIILRVFAASRSRRGDKGRNDRRFLEALHYFVVHNITWRALPVSEVTRPTSRSDVSTTATAGADFSCSKRKASSRQRRLFTVRISLVMAS